MDSGAAIAVRRQWRIVPRRDEEVGLDGQIEFSRTTPEIIAWIGSAAPSEPDPLTLRLPRAHAGVEGSGRERGEMRAYRWSGANCKSGNADEVYGRDKGGSTWMERRGNPSK